MDKVEIYKNIKERYHVVTYEDSIPLKNNSGSETIFGIEEKPKKTKLPKWVVKQEFLNSEENTLVDIGSRSLGACGLLPLTPKMVCCTQVVSVNSITKESPKKFTPIGFGMM